MSWATQTIPWILLVASVRTEPEIRTGISFPPRARTVVSRFRMEDSVVPRRMIDGRLTELPVGLTSFPSFPRKSRKLRPKGAFRLSKGERGFVRRSNLQLESVTMSASSIDLRMLST
jgi:hypothetical protein